MNNAVLNSLCSYYDTLKTTGYVSYDLVYKLLIFVFYKNFLSTDYKGIINEQDYNDIYRAINCIVGDSCFIPYSQYLSNKIDVNYGSHVMGYTNIGVSELTLRIKNLERYIGLLSDDDNSKLADINKVTQLIVNIDLRIQDIEKSKVVRTLSGEYMETDEIPD